MLVKFSTLADGVFIEQRDEDEYQADTRCFRFDDAGRASYAYYGDLTGWNPAPRWFGHIYHERDFIFA